ncbi:TIGR03086 family metal-binding protein [Amycolatopsis aidingensis]|uniref:TIGR03086 family metal-binding protein n=1 Tax=Amycolatopsis aidingensis TaxID=2842453 RepID=UPI001C0C4D79|nr:TIGR03086 family metal-binding protein [Amycolatopsis aidingensis]
MDLRQPNRAVLHLHEQLVATVSTADLERPTPCAEWNLGALLQHLISENHAFAEAATHGAAADWDGGSLGDDPHRALADSIAAVTSAFDREGMLEREVAIRDFGTFPGSTVVGMHLVDSVVHGWDLASALGRRYEPEPEAVRAALRFMESVPDDPEGRGPDGPFDKVVPVPQDAPPLHRLLGLTGRSPDWAAKAGTATR